MHNDIYNRWMAKQIDWRIFKHIEKGYPKDILGCLIWLQYSLSDATLQLNQMGSQVLLKIHVDSSLMKIQCQSWTLGIRSTF